VKSVLQLFCTDSLRTCCEQVLFWRRLSVCLSVRRKSQKLLIRNRCNLVGICAAVNARSDWKLVTFDLESYFVYLPRTCHLLSSFECLNIGTSFSVWRDIFRISRSPSSFKVMGLISRSQQQKSGRAQVCAPLGHGLISFEVWTCTFDIEFWFIVVSCQRLLLPNQTGARHQLVKSCH